jgi:hypothetical protein
VYMSNKFFVTQPGPVARIIGVTPVWVRKPLVVAAVCILLSACGAATSTQSVDCSRPADRGVVAGDLCVFLQGNGSDTEALSTFVNRYIMPQVGATEDQMRYLLDLDGSSFHGKDEQGNLIHFTVKIIVRQGVDNNELIVISQLNQPDGEITGEHTLDLIIFLPTGDNLPVTSEQIREEMEYATSRMRELVGEYTDRLPEN